MILDTLIFEAEQVNRTKNLKDIHQFSKIIFGSMIENVRFLKLW